MDAPSPTRRGVAKADAKNLQQISPGGRIPPNLKVFSEIPGLLSELHAMYTQEIKELRGKGLVPVRSGVRWSCAMR